MKYIPTELREQHFPKLINLNIINYNPANVSKLLLLNKTFNLHFYLHYLQDCNSETSNNTII